MAKSKNNMPTLAKADVFRPKDVYTIVNAVLQHTGGMGFSLSAAMLLALAKGGAA